MRRIEFSTRASEETMTKKEITMDFKTYKNEIGDAHRCGYYEAVQDLKKIYELVGKSKEFEDCFSEFGCAAYDFMSLRHMIVFINEKVFGYCQKKGD
jgi:hypothetical protein